MLAADKEKIDDLVVGVLAERPNQTAAEMYALLKPRMKKSLTPPGWYKVLNRLVAQEVLVKTKKTYSLNVRWVLSLARLAEKAERANITAPPFPVIRLPRGKERVIYRFTDLIEMDAFWAHLLITLAARSKKPVRYDCYTPHFWFFLVHEQSETEFHKGMKKLGVKIRYLLGSQSFLDRWSTSFFDSSFITSRLYPVPLYSDTRKTHISIGDYYVETAVSEEAARAIKMLFERTKSLNDISPLELIRIFRGRSPSTMIVSKSTTKRTKLKRIMNRYIPR